MDKPIVQIHNVEELKKVLFLQKAIAQQAKAEVIALTTEADDGGFEAKADRILTEGAKLIERYAKYPTLTEFALQHKLADATKWGATFGVALIIGELIFEQVKEMHPHFGSVMRQMYILFLNELDTGCKYIGESLEKAVTFKVESEDGSNVSEETQRSYTRGLVRRLVEDLIVFSVEYGLVSAKDKSGFAITPIGRRVLLHLLDASKFIDDMTKAHERFQSARPKLSMT